MEGRGWGGRKAADGNKAQGVINGNCHNTPIEVFEARYPWRVHPLGLVPDSGGAGRTRGGLSSERVLEVVAEEIVVSEFADRTETRPRGLFGGLPGCSAATLVRRGGESCLRTSGEAFGTASNTKFSGVVLRRGDVVSFRTAGGGYCDPLGRPRTLVARDLERRFVGDDAARRLYGLEPEPAA
jgi:N-methylhydantoinase B/oxoprolinase/acetone carboxylase alpha subunit